MKKIILTSALLAMLLPSVSFAAPARFPYWGPFLSCTGIPGGANGLPQCQSLCDVMATGKNFLDFGLTVLFLIIAPLLFVYGGVLIMISGGNPGLHSKGVDTIKRGVIAVLIVMAAYIIVNTFVTALGIAQSQNKSQSFVQGFTGGIECSVPPYNPSTGSNDTSNSCSDSNPSGTCPKGQSCDYNINTGGYSCQ